MRVFRRRTAGLLAAAIVLAVPVHSVAAPPKTSSHWDPASSVTLITGDTVRLNAAGQPEIKKLRPHISYAVQRAADHLYVVPSDAADLVTQGKLDRRLFDVTALLADGLNDKQSKEVRLIVEGAQGKLRSINASPVKLAKTQATANWTAFTRGARKIWLDGKRELSLDKSVPQIGAPEAWKAGLTGKGIKVAVLDTGIDVTHPDLAGKVIATANFTADTPGDHLGHGTHVASTIAGSGAASGGKYKGVAPDAQLLDGKVCFAGCYDSDVVAGMEWAVAQGADVVNLSLGGADTPEIDPLEEAVNRLSSQALFVVAAGNQPYCTSIRNPVASPATADAALAVGAVDKSDVYAGFTCTGPRLGDHAIKPDITAPGVDIVAARASEGILGEPVDEHYVRMSGTSMATPHVVGAAAILAQQHPDWTPGRLKASLMASSKPNADQTVFQQGAGRVDVAAATTQNVVPIEGTLSYPLQVWPHTDDVAVDKTITYQNSGTTDVTLTLVVAATGPDAKPASTFTLSRPSVEVPAGGTAQVTVTANTKLDGPDGFYTGRVTATSGTSHLTTALSVEREAEAYDLTIKHLDRKGRPAGPVETLVASTDGTGVVDAAYQPTTVLRLPKGKYTLNSYLRLEDAEGNEDKVFLAAPELDLSKDTTITLDAAKSKPVRVSAPRPGAAPGSIVLSFSRRNTLSFAYVTAGSFAGISTAQVGPAIAAKGFASSLQTQWCEPDQEGFCANNSSYQYFLQWYVKGKLFTGFDKAVRPQDLAVVKSDFAATSANTLSELVLTAVPTADLPQYQWSQSAFPALPSKVTVYLQPEGIRWSAQFREVAIDPGTGDWSTRTEFGGSPRTYRAGTTTVEHWNKGVHGPGFPATDTRPFDPAPRPWASRAADRLHTDLPLFTDGFGHAGFAPADQTRTTLKRDGKVIAESTEAPGTLEADLPAGNAQYRLEVEAKRSSQGLSSEVSAMWTFNSASTTTTTALPLSAIRFSPTLNERNQGKPGWIPVHVERQPGSTAKPATSLAVQGSFDDGKTWSVAPLRRTGSDWQAKITPPAGTEHVSLRAQSTDRSGNTVEQTVLRAYAISG